MAYSVLILLLGSDGMIRINGKNFDQSLIKLTEYLDQNRLNQQKIAIELNGEILPRSKYNDTVLTDADKVEIVSFMGGG